MADEAHRRRMDSPVQPAIWSYLHRQAQRFAALVARWQAGTLPAARSPRKRPAPDPTAVRQPRPPGVLPRGANWFRKLFPDTSTPFSGNLYELSEAGVDMRALVAAAPQAGRILRPLLRMLGTKPPLYLQLPRRPRRPRPAKPRQPRKINVERMSARKYGDFIHPEREPMNGRPPNWMNYARARRWPKPS